MSISLQREHGNVYRIEISGLLRKAEFEKSEIALADEVRRTGQVRLLVVLDNFAGWEEHGDWNDLSFYVKHGNTIDRIAIVGDSKWHSPALMFAAAGLRRAPVQFFSEGDLTAARAWLSASSNHSCRHERSTP